MIPRIFLGTVAFCGIAFFWWTVALVGLRGGSNSIDEEKTLKAEIKALDALIDTQNRSLQVPDRQGLKSEDEQAREDAINKLDQEIAQQNEKIKEENGRLRKSADRVVSIWEDLLGKDDGPPSEINEKEFERAKDRINEWLGIEQYIKNQIIWVGDPLSTSDNRTLKDAINICTNVFEKLKGAFKDDPIAREQMELSACDVGQEKFPVEISLSSAAGSGNSEPVEDTSTGENISDASTNENAGNTSQAQNYQNRRNSVISNLVQQVRVVPVNVEVAGLIEGGGKRLVLDLIKDKVFVLREMAVNIQESTDFDETGELIAYSEDREVVSLTLDYYLFSDPQYTESGQSEKNRQEKKRDKYISTQLNTQFQQCLKDLSAILENTDSQEIEDAEDVTAENEQLMLRLDECKEKYESDTEDD